ncbi:hypothetical protein STANM309S_03877 [Streptomyces tanashiensis]
MDSWMISPGFTRAIILNRDFKEIGIGLHTAGGPYWTCRSSALADAHEDPGVTSMTSDRAILTLP